MSTNPFAQGPKAFGYTGQEEPTDYWDKYEQQGQKATRGPLPKGRYTFRVPEPGENFYPQEQKPKENKPVTFIMHLAVVAPVEYAGREIRYVRFSTSKQPWRDGSMAGDLLLACGNSATPKTAEDWFAIAPFLSGKLFDADVDMSVYDKDARTTLWKRAEDLPPRKDGSPMTVIVLRPDGTPVQDCGDPVQQRLVEDAVIAAGGRKLFANNDVKRVYPPA